MMTHCHKPTLTAGLALATALTLSCSGDGGNEPPPGTSSAEISSSSDAGGGNPSSSSVSSSGVVSSSSSEVSSSSSEPAHEHVWGDWVETAAPTCGTKGVKTRACTIDPSHVETGEIDKVELSSTQFCHGNKIGSFCGARTETFDPDLYECETGDKIYLKGGLADSRDGGKQYAAVLIGTQTWMAENLNYDVPDNTTDVCYGNDDSNCDKYGRLYDWATAMNNSASSSANPSGVRGVCPEGWHLPSDAEWGALMQSVNPSCTPTGTCANAGTKLKADSPLWNSNGKGTDDFGFSALPGGYRYFEFNNVGSLGAWWSSTESTDSYAYRRYINGNSANVDRSSNDKIRLYSVRCIQN